MSRLLKRMFNSLKNFFSPSMRIEVHGSKNCQVFGIGYRPLYKRLRQLPDGIFAKKPYQLKTSSGVYAEFVVRGHTFQIEEDPWDDSLWIVPRDEQSHPTEVEGIRAHLQKFCS